MSKIKRADGNPSALLDSRRLFSDPYDKLLPGLYFVVAEVVHVLDLFDREPVELAGDIP